MPPAVSDPRLPVTVARHDVVGDEFLLFEADLFAELIPPPAGGDDACLLRDNDRRSSTTS